MLKETNTPVPASDLAAENAALKARIAEFESARKQSDADEILVAEKMTKGLRREQAQAVIKRQREFDARKQLVAAKK